MTAAPLPPNSTIGIFGGGQLGQMTALAAAALGYRAAVLDPNPDAPAMRVAAERVVAPYHDLAAAEDLARRSDVLTYEFENVSVEAVEAAAAVKEVCPGVAVLRVARNRLEEKRAAEQAGAGTAPYRKVESAEDLRSAAEQVGLPGILKTATMGYDGKGQYLLERAEDADAALAAMGGSALNIYEGLVDIRKEVSVIVACGRDGEVMPFPVPENRHSGGILDVSVAPARIEERVRREAVEIAEALARRLGVVGLLTVEMFVDAGGRLLVNEMAPRPHNSGHYTIEGCATSQFEQLARALAGMPLGAADLLFPVAMANLLGEVWEDAGGAPDFAAMLREEPRAKLHLYGKAPPKAGRKMGHVTVAGETADEAEAAALRCRARLTA